MSDGIGLAEALLGQPGFRVVDVVETDSEVVVSIESTATRVFCRGCAKRAEAQDRLRSISGICRVSVGRRGCGGRNGGGGAHAPGVPRRRGPSSSTPSTRKPW
jgi:hypothetical protein